MPNRIIKESICVSDSIDSLGWFEEVLFYRLIVNCDDYGRFDGRTAVIKNRLFPLKDNLTLKNVDTAIKNLARTGLIFLYEYDGKPFLFLPGWNEHQSIRAKRSKYPDPDDPCAQMISDDCKCPRNPIQSNPNPIRESESESAQTNARENAFAEFWEAYPKKVGKKDAYKAFCKLSKADWPKLVPAVEQQKQSKQWQKDEGQFIPNPSTWLNQGRWDDDLAHEQLVQNGPKYAASCKVDVADLEALHSRIKEI
jgi:hypothetical protein